MPDPTTTPATPQTPSVTPGVETSEYKTTKVVMIIGGILQAIGAGLTAIQAATTNGLVPSSPALGLVLAIAPIVIGSAMQVLQALGYTQSRTDIKTAAVAAGAAAAKNPMATINQ